jgi:hypothetical protein
MKKGDAVKIEYLDHVTANEIKDSAPIRCEILGFYMYESRMDKRRFYVIAMEKVAGTGDLQFPFFVVLKDAVISIKRLPE